MSFRKFLVNTFKALLTLIVSVIILGVFAGVLLRYFFRFPIVGLDTIITTIVVWWFFIGIIYASYKGVHVHSGFLTFRGGLTQHLVYLILRLFCLIVTLIFLFLSCQSLIWTIEKNVIEISLRMPLSIVVAVVPLALTAVSAYLIRDMVQITKKVIKLLREG